MGVHQPAEEGEGAAAATTPTRARIKKSPITTTMTTRRAAEENTTNTNNLRVARKPKLNLGKLLAPAAVGVYV